MVAKEHLFITRCTHPWQLRMVLRACVFLVCIGVARTLFVLLLLLFFAVLVSWGQLIDPVGVFSAR